MERPYPPSPIPHPPAPKVLLIMPQWPARALLMAELEAQGLDVLGADSVGTALDLSTSRAFRPCVIVMDQAGLPATGDEFSRLQFVRSGAPLLLLASSQYDSPIAATLPPTVVLRRPFSVGEVVDAVLRLTRAEGK